MNKKIVLTGAFSYTGAAIAEALLQSGYVLHSLTNRKPRAQTPITFAPLEFNSAFLRSELSDASVFINTYWIRFPYREKNFLTAIENSKMLIDAAVNAGVERIVHISVCNANADKKNGYYAGKAEVENYVRNCKIPYTIIKPTLVIGLGNLLTNNIAWLLKKFPFFLIPKNGLYPLQPIMLNDLAHLVAEAVEHNHNQEIDAAGPEQIPLAAFVELIAKACNIPCRMIPVPENLFLMALKLIELFLNDIILTKEELKALKEGLLTSKNPPLGKESVSEWLKLNASQLGQRYINDLDMHFRRGKHHSLKTQ